ncbi:hypothetical protein BDV96DRAFT_203373 [Lophiotrema nucula]|uniref:Tautomerase cis-CaaD-like domain-containing protein n=1 Tax=Lophiotrema nucula TaxID=690887 RepID=A0A6A5ZN72_9PLEO|nr:hypothetical protein BDV96DRAFT_203373 [Lophiotrema nucula]
MPLYEVFHGVHLTPIQRASLAKKLTHLHCSTFSAPSIFVNVTFHAAKEGDVEFAGGKEVPVNKIIAHLRPRPTKPADTIPNLTSAIIASWNSVVYDKAPEFNGRIDDEKALHTVFIMEDISGGAEQGFILPLAGKDGDGVWAEEQMPEFEKRAAAGDKSVEKLIEEIHIGLGNAKLDKAE